MELEALVEPGQTSAEPPYPFALVEQPGGIIHLESSPMWLALLEDLSQTDSGWSNRCTLPLRARSWDP